MSLKARAGLRLALASALALGPRVPAFALSAGSGTSGAQFLKLGAGSRAAAMGEAHSATVDDVYALYYNPAALTRLTVAEIAAAHAEHFQGINYEFAGFAYPMGRGAGYSKHALGFAIYNLSVSDIERRTEDTANSIGSFGAGDYSYNLSYARRHGPTLSWGGTGKVIHQKIDSYSASAFAVDGGLLYRPLPEAKRPYALSLVMRNFGTRPSFAGVSDPLPFGIVAGLGYEPLPGRLKLDLDLNKYRDTGTFFTLGGEYWHSFSPELRGALRGGLTTHRLSNQGFNEITLGAGFTMHRATFDFAWVPFGTLGNTFRFSFKVRFAGEKTKVAASTPAPATPAPATPARPAPPVQPAPPAPPAPVTPVTPTNPAETPSFPGNTNP